MSRTFGKLNDLKIKAAKASSSLQKLTDGRGLQLWITPQNSKYWRFDYRFEGKRKLLALGTYPDISLAKARELSDTARKQVAHGIDPSQARKDERLVAAESNANSFGSVAERLTSKKRREGRADSTISKMEWIIGKVKPDLGAKPISEITTPQIIKVLQREEEAGNLETARRMRTVLGEIFRYGIQTGICSNDPTASTKGAIATPKAKHHAAVIDPQQFGVLLRTIESYAQRNIKVGSALKLMALLYPRPGELRQADWSEFDITNALWTIPASRTKMRQTHVVPLPKPALDILATLYEISGPLGFVFPATGQAKKCISENTMNIALRRMGISSETHTSHGFRATASTLLNASGKFSIDAIERSLAHQDKDSIRRAYARGDSLAERKIMAAWWSEYCETLRNGNGQAHVQPSLP